MKEQFDAFWKNGPWLKLGRKAAERHFNATVKTDQDWRDIQTARDRYAAHLKESRWKHPQHGSTWFNNWRDWIDFDVPTATETAHTGQHFCGFCKPGHGWQCGDPCCELGPDAMCNEFLDQRLSAQMRLPVRS